MSVIRFLVFTDLHYDHVFDAEERLDSLIDRINDLSLDFVVSLGDLCYPVGDNRPVIRKLHSLGIPFYYCVGNHDCENSSPQAIEEFTGLSKLFYSFSVRDIRFIILNTCFMEHDQKEMLFQKGQYPIIPRYEADWLNEEMADTSMKYVIFSHHSLANDFGSRGVVNREAIRTLLEKRRTVLVMNGHDHGDDLKIINGIPYFTVNSASYIWHDREKFAYSKNIHKEYPFMKNMILYKSPLYCVVEMEDGNVKIYGTESDYQTVTPEDAGIAGRRWNGVSIEPEISGWSRRG